MDVRNTVTSTNRAFSNFARHSHSKAVTSRPVPNHIERLRTQSTPALELYRQWCGAVTAIRDQRGEATLSIFGYGLAIHRMCMSYTTRTFHCCNREQRSTDGAWAGFWALV